MLVWNEPKMDWQPPDGVSDEDFNRIETNIAILDQSQASINVKRFGAAGDGSVENESPTIQAALDAGAGKEIFIPDGEYKLQDRLLIRSGTRLRLGANARMVRNSNSLDTLLLFWDGGEPTGYNGVSNILVEGGIWNVNGSSFPNECNGFAIAHAQNIIIRDVEILDVPEWHAIEINASRNVRVVNSIFDGVTVTGERRGETIQIDGAFSDIEYPFHGAYDNTICDTVIITGCIFLDSDRGIGTHQVRETGTPTNHRNIIISNNYFERMAGQAVRGMCWEEVEVTGNVIKECGGGVNMQTWKEGRGSVQARHINISGNVMTGWKGSPYSGKGIMLSGISGSPFYYCNISGNVIEAFEDDGILCEYTSFTSIGNNSIANMARHGIYMHYSCQNNSITGNNINRSDGRGIFIRDESRYNVINGNRVRRSGEDGILINESSDSNVIVGNLINTSSYDNAGVSDNIRLSEDSNENIVTDNQTRSGGSARYACSITSTCRDNKVYHNFFTGGGIVGKLLDSGVDTVTEVSGNY